MLRAICYLPLALLFLASVVPTHGQMRRAEPEVTGGEKEVKVALGAPLTVECTLRPEQRVDWKLDGATVPSDMRPAESPANEALTARLTVPAARANHAGVYTCARSSPRIRVRVTGAATEAATEDPITVSTSDGAAGSVLYYEVRGNFILNCTSLGSGTIVWKKNGTALEDYPLLKGHVVTQPSLGIEDAILTISGRATEQDFGNYSCSNGAGELAWQVKGRPHAKIATDTNVVEGQKLKITCKVFGRPCEAVAWHYSNTSEEVINGSDVREVFGSRVKLSKSDAGLEDAELILEPAERTDAGWFRCTPLAEERANATSFITRLRVKDMYAALWPFLGICAEVFILCAIILVYEKRRTKPELDDSDTDNHDQKKS